MNKIKNKLRSILILLTVLLVVLNINGFITTIKAGPDIPEEHFNNGWHWGIDAGDELYWEVEVIITNVSSGEVTQMFKDIWIFNITTIENVTIDWLGVHEFSQVNATQCFYNVTEDIIEPYGPPSEFAIFGYNNSDSIQHKVRAGMGAAPYILPLNGSSFDVDVLDDILNESFFDPLSMQGYNKFDTYSSNIGDNSITFSNSSDNYYLYMEFNPTDGVAEYAEGYLMVTMGEPMWINVTMERAMDYYITDEIEWGVDIGDTIYYDWYEDGGDYYDKKVEIIDITNMTLPKSKNAFWEGEVNMIFQVVFANLSTWNGIDYELEMGDIPIGVANNFYFQYFDEGSTGAYQFLIPSTTVRDDIEFLWNLNTPHIWGLPFDEIELVENGNFEFSIGDSSGTLRVSQTIDKSTGIVQSYLIHEFGDIDLYIEIKNMTLVEWDLEVGDFVYYKQNSRDGEIYRKVTIIGSHGEFVNLTEWEIDSGGLFTKIPGQPELQFFKMLGAAFEEFDEVTGTWQYLGEDLFLMANIYWPIAPQAMFGGYMPLFIPLGYSGEDVENLLSLLSGIFDDNTFTEDHVSMRNTTLDRGFDTYIDTNTGAITFMGGWMNMPGGDNTTWLHMTLYPMHNETLHSGTNTVSVPNDAVGEIAVSEIELITNNADVEIANAILKNNPINTSINNGTILYYNDLLITNTTGLDNLTFYIKFDSTFLLINYKLTFWAWNMSGNNAWEAAPQEAVDMFVYDYVDNSLTIIFPISGTTGPLSIIMAVSYISIGSEAIPGYPFLMILGLLSLCAIILVKIQSRKVKKL